MAKQIRGITIELDGNTTKLDKALNAVNKTSRELSGELKDVERALKFDPGNATLIAQKQEILAESVENTAKKLKILKDSQEDVEKAFKNGDIGADQYRAFQREVTKTEGILDNFKKQADDFDTKVKFKADTSEIENVKATVDIQADTSSLDRIKSKLSDVKSEAKDAGKAIGDAIGKGSAAAFGAGSAAVVGMSDLNNDLARLRTNAKLADVDIRLVEKAFRDIVAVSGETDSAVETLSNLLAAGIKDSDLEQVIEGINGAAIKFSDTLKTEGIADGLQETFKSGEATGMFAELLERSGIKVETFNEQLAIAKQFGDETNLVLEKLAGAGLLQVNEEYQKSNEALVENNQAVLDFQTALADLAIVLTPIITFITALLTKIIEWMEANPTLTQTLFLVVGALTGLMGIILVISPIITALSGLAIALGVSIGALALPIAIAIASIVAIIAIGVTLYKNWDTIKQKSGELLSALIVNFIKIKNTIKDKIVEAIKAVRDKVSDFKSIGSDMISGLMSGIGGMARKLIDKVKGTIGDAISAAKNLLGINSPSRVFMEIGKFTGEGMAIGMDSTARMVDAAGKRMAEASIPNMKQNSNSISPPQPMQSVITGNQFIVREEADIKRIAQELHKLQLSASRGSFA